MAWLRREKKQFAPVRGIDFAVVGLGNPGKQYENTRHNIGFMAIDFIADKMGAKVNRIKFKGVTGEGELNGKRVLLLKPATFMNLSGQSVTEMMRFYQLKPEQVLLIYDDVSLPIGKLRIRRSGSDGGHNGVKNIIYLSGSDAFPRIKVGVGSKPHPDYDLADWVLSKFTQSEQKQFAELFNAVEAAAGDICIGEIDHAMNCCN